MSAHSKATSALREKPAYTFDTDYVDSEYLGINAAKRHHFRRRATCAPLRSDGEHILEISYNRSGLSRPMLFVQDGSELGMSFYSMSWKPYELDVGLYIRFVSPNLTVIVPPPLKPFKDKPGGYSSSPCYQSPLHGVGYDGRCPDNDNTSL